MINSSSHTLEYKPNDIIIISFIGYVLLHNPNIIETIRHLDYIASFPGSTSKDLGGGALVLYLALLRLLTAPAPRNGRLDFHHVTVSRGHGARALECALLCRAA